MGELSWNVTIQLVISVWFIKDQVVECDFPDCDCLEVPASYRVVPLTRTDKHFLITVKISLNLSDEEEMTCSELQMQHNLKNKPRCCWSCDNCFCPCLSEMLENRNNMYQDLPQGCFWGDVEMRRQAVAWNSVYLMLLARRESRWTTLSHNWTTCALWWRPSK